MTPGSSLGVPYTPRAQTFSGSSYEEDITSSAAGGQHGTATLASATNWYAVCAVFQPYPATPPVPPAEEPAQLFQSEPKEADKWGWPQHDMSANYDLRLTVPPGYTWDGDAQYVKDSVARLAQVR